jgi:homogentisate phytyltransferase/homogentisate geranylgeranyltransferase
MAIAGPVLLKADAEPVVLTGGHLAALALLCVWSRAADPRDREAFTRFYMRVWALFFLEYVLVPLACLAG